MTTWTSINKPVSSWVTVGKASSSWTSVGKPVSSWVSVPKAVGTSSIVVTQVVGGTPIGLLMALTQSSVIGVTSVVTSLWTDVQKSTTSWTDVPKAT